MTVDLSALRADPQWRARVRDWTRGSLAGQGILVQGEPAEVRVRPWSIVLRVSTDSGTLYFKAAPPALSHELGLSQWLAQQFPSSVPAVLAAEPGEGWWLMRDGGESIRDRLQQTRDLGEWQAALRQYAGLQIQSAARVPDLLALDIPDRRPSVLDSKFEELLLDKQILRVGLQDGLTPDEYTRLQTLVPQVRVWGAELAAAAIPAGLHHGDLNSSNVLRAPNAPGFIFVDWGDASVAHPFFSLRTALVSCESALDLPDNDPSLAPLRDAYLGAWSAFASRERLLEIYAQAHRLAPLCGALGWHRIVSTLTPALQAEFAEPVPALLKEFLEQDLTKFPFV